MAWLDDGYRLTVLGLVASTAMLGACDVDRMRSRMDRAYPAYGSIKDSPPETAAPARPAKVYVEKAAAHGDDAQPAIRVTERSNEPSGAMPAPAHHGHVLEGQVIVPSAPVPAAGHPLFAKPAQSAAVTPSPAAAPSPPIATAPPANPASGMALPPVRLPSAVAPPKAATAPAPASPSPSAGPPLAPFARPQAKAPDASPNAATDTAKAAPPIVATMPSTPAPPPPAAAPAPSPLPAQPAPAAPPAPPPAPAASAPVVASPSAGLSTTITEARALFEAGDVVKAREKLQSIGNGNAKNPDLLLELGRTYDPNYLDRLAKKDVTANPALARALYEQAASFGSSAAAFDLLQLRRSHPEQR